MTGLDKIREIQEDFQQRNAPFDDVTFPEERLLEELSHDSMEDRARLVSAFATFDYNRDANQLVDNLIELYYRNHEYFDPGSMKFIPEESLSDVFDDIGFRYSNRDSKAWAENCYIVRDKYNDMWTELLLSVSSDAPGLVERLDKDGFYVMKGDKVAPMYARIIDDFVAPLNNVWDVEIPVDTWVRKISKEIFQEDLTDDEIRDKWQQLATKENIDRHVVDGGIWQIGNNLNEWGEDYLKEVLDTERFKYL